MSTGALAAVAGLVVAYLLASVPFGLLVARATGRADPRAGGSGNIGATNVLRTVGARAGAVTLLLDVLKGSAAVLLARSLGPSPSPGEPLAWGSVYLTAALVLPVVGHCFPIWIGFRGGKGVATALGVLLAVWWPGALAGIAVFAVVVVLTRTVSLASLLAAAALPLVLALRPEVRALYLPAGLLISGLLAARHHENIGRLARGTEHRLGRPGGAGGGSS